MKKPIISTPRLMLHKIADQDAEAVVDLFLSPVVAKTYMVPELPNREAAYPLFERIKTLSADPERFVYGVYFDQQFIGLVNQVDVQEKTIELGYAYLPQYYNQGFATEALIACINALLKDGYDAVRTGAFEENAASLRVMEKAGMVRIDETETVEYRGKDRLCIFYEQSQKNISKK